MHTWPIHYLHFLIINILSEHVTLAQYLNMKPHFFPPTHFMCKSIAWFYCNGLSGKLPYKYAFISMFSDTTCPAVLRFPVFDVNKVKYEGDGGNQNIAQKNWNKYPIWCKTLKFLVILLLLYSGAYLWGGGVHWVGCIFHILMVPLLWHAYTASMLAHHYPQ